MKDEYIIINRATLEKRIEELESLKRIYCHSGAHPNKSEFTRCNNEQSILKKLIDVQSTPLIPVIEDAFKEGRISCISSKSPTGIIEQQEYISNLKIGI